jgi:hypothetical protein
MLAVEDRFLRFTGCVDTGEVFGAIDYENKRMSRFFPWNRGTSVSSVLQLTRQFYKSTIV